MTTQDQIKAALFATILLCSLPAHAESSQTVTASITVVDAITVDGGDGAVPVVTSDGSVNY